MFYIRYWKFFFFFWGKRYWNSITIIYSFGNIIYEFGSINVYKKLVYVNFQNFLAHLDWWVPFYLQQKKRPFLIKDNKIRDNYILPMCDLWEIIHFLPLYIHVVLPTNTNKWLWVWMIMWFFKMRNEYEITYLCLLGGPHVQYNSRNK